MNSPRIPGRARMLLAAGLFAGIAGAAHAAGGYAVKPGQETLVAPGMSKAQVQQALGRPAMTAQYRNEPGPTFTYYVVGVRKLFDVDFNADGSVLSTSERDEPGY